MKALILIAALFGSAAVFAAPCVEGKRAIFTEQDSNDHSVTVIRTCKNGSYYDLSNYVYNPTTKCKEGARSIFTEHDNNDRSVTVIRTCKNGSYYDLSNYVYNPNTKCKEGRVQYFTEHNNINDRSVSVRYVCVGGKYVKN